MEKNFNIVAKTLFGFEDLFKKELTKLRAQHVKNCIRNVSFTVDKVFMYKCN